MTLACLYVRRIATTRGALDVVELAASDDPVRAYSGRIVHTPKVRLFRAEFGPLDPDGSVPPAGARACAVTAHNTVPVLLSLN